MANTIPFSLITPTRIAFEGDVELVIAVGTEGEEGILPSHAPFLTALRPGVLRANVRKENGETDRLEFATGEGFLQALPDRLAVLTDEALTLDQIDRDQAKSELDAALDRQKGVTPQTLEYAREQVIVDFANAKLALAGVHS
jgi:F-type H+-transporting ATPase subunit epsilon